MKKADKLIVVFGEPQDGGLRAARANYADREQVTAAAAAMGYSVGVAKSGKDHTVISRLPQIKLYKSGRALVPKVKSETFAKLTALLKPLKVAPPSPQPSPDTAGENDRAEVFPGPITNPWAELRAGSLVLASDADWEGWFEAHVVRLTDHGRILVLKWRDYPRLKPFTARRTEVALPPSACPVAITPEPPQSDDDPPIWAPDPKEDPASTQANG